MVHFGKRVDAVHNRIEPQSKKYIKCLYFYIIYVEPQSTPFFFLRVHNTFRSTQYNFTAYLS